MSLRITPLLRLEFAQHNAGILRARKAYYEGPEPPHCPTGRCDTEHLCHRCRAKAADDLLVATSIDECAELLARLDLPKPERKDLKPCGTPAAYQRHIRHGEKPCQPCHLANRADKKTTRKLELNRQRQRRFKAAKKKRDQS